MSLDEFSRLIEDDEKIDDLLNLIYDLELDEVMNYDQGEIENLERTVYNEVSERHRKDSLSKEEELMERVLKRLEKYEK